ncbi:hypothetical protein ALQ28_102049 [Pseudomonas syringae pv. delphinii]|uniref:Uncharacterized protein n=1 Tax=Pseudomonas syringae pv. delphinii TaxID=192088 RepID=A0A0P9QRP9_9PSED|nr:hypothetical protein ALO72_101739 [Pseudomonas syringae pv. delphinii]RMP13506.1 hypothetical protein ALQ28_102049 [Pseudomonas syringae pv. delphinii]
MASITRTSAASTPFTDPRRGLVALSTATWGDGKGVEVGKSLFPDCWTGSRNA